MCSFSGSGEVNSSGLIGWWKLDDENSTIIDYSGSGNNGRLYGNTRLLLDFNNETEIDRTSYNNTGILMNGVDCTVTGVNGKGCTFDGIDDYIESTDLIFNGKPFSISLWVNPKGQQSSYGWIFGNYGVVTNNIVALQFSIGNQFYFIIRNNAL